MKEEFEKIISFIEAIEKLKKSIEQRSLVRV